MAAPGLVGASSSFEFGRDVLEGVEYCLLPPSEEEVAVSEQQMLQSTRNFDVALGLVPVAAPGCAFVFYAKVAAFARYVLDSLVSGRNYESVDGGAYEIAILTPTINGLVMPALSIAFGTLTATTRAGKG